MTTQAKSEAAAKKDIQKLQRAIVDGLEDVKAQDIQVFNTETLSPLFERVIVASGTSNRQTKALASSVRDAVREAGFGKPRIEGEDNGEWIIVDCGAAVVHVMQPAIRQYYRLEEIWGATAVRLKLGAPKPVIPEAESKPARKKAPAKKAAAAPAGRRASVSKATGLRTTAYKDLPDAPAKEAPAKAGAAKKAVPAKKVAASSSKAPARKAVAGTAARKTTAAKTAAKPATKTVVVNKPVARKAAAKAPAKTAGRSALARKTPRTR